MSSFSLISAIIEQASEIEAKFTSAYSTGIYTNRRREQLGRIIVAEVAKSVDDLQFHDTGGFFMITQMRDLGVNQSEVSFSGFLLYNSKKSDKTYKVDFNFAYDDENRTYEYERFYNAISPRMLTPSTLKLKADLEMLADYSILSIINELETQGIDEKSSSSSFFDDEKVKLFRQQLQKPMELDYQG